MDKVKSIAPRAIRFLDTRKDRFKDYPQIRWNKHLREVLRDIAKEHSGLYKSLRKDARFAAPRLATALGRCGDAGIFGVHAICRRPLSAHNAELPWTTGWEVLENLSYWLQMVTAAHPALSNPSRIACYPTRADAARGREVMMTPGKFFAALHDRVEPTDVQTFAENYLASKTPLQVHFIDNNVDGCDEEELKDHWMEAYRNPRGFTSCMSDFPANDKHPARFYARKGNGLSLAYITTDGDPYGPVCARSIVNRDKGAYVRCYGDARLARALEERGLGCCVETALRGAGCNAKEVHGNLVAPYLDGEMQIQWDGCGDYCTIVNEGNYYAQETDGFASNGNDSSVSCDECGDTVDEDDVSYSSYHDSRICHSCCQAHFTTAYTGRTTMSLVRDSQVISLHGENYLDDNDVLTAHGFVWSDCEEEWLDQDDAIYLEYLSDYASVGNVVKLDVEHEGSSYAREEDTKTVTLCVHEDYDGPEGVTDEEKPAPIQLAA